jgi:hypothetical protein
MVFRLAAEIVLLIDSTRTLDARKMDIWLFMSATSGDITTVTIRTSAMIPVVGRVHTAKVHHSRQLIAQTLAERSGGL